MFNVPFFSCLQTKHSTELWIIAAEQREKKSYFTSDFISGVNIEIVCVY